MAWWNDAHPGRHISVPTISKYKTHKKRAVRTSPKALLNPEELKRFLNLTGMTRKFNSQPICVACEGDGGEDEAGHASV